MKKMMKFFGIIAVAAMSLTACQNDFEEQVNINEKTVIVDITANTPATRSGFTGEKDADGYISEWTGNEAVGFSVNAGTFVDVNNTTAGASTKFSGVELSAATEGYIYAVSPRNKVNNAYDAGGWRTVSSYYKNFSFAIPATQTPNAHSVDESAHVLFAEYAITDGAIPASIDMTFKHIGAYGKMSIKNYNGATIEKITLTSTDNFIGQAYYYYEKAEAERFEAQSYASPTLTLETSNTEVWFACFPVGTLTGNLTMVITDVDGATYTKELATANRLAFKAGQVSAFSVDMSKDVIVDTPAAGELSATIDFTDTTQRQSLTEGMQVWENDDVVVTVEKSTGNPIANYSPIRLYKSHVVTISAPGNITKCVFECTSASYATVLATSTGGTANGTIVTFTPSTTKTEQSFTMTAQSRVNNLTVTYSTTSEIVPTLGDITNLTATPNGKEITIKWDEVTNAESYVVTCGDQSKTVDECEATFTMDKYGTYYDITVTAQASGYNNSNIAETTVRTDNDPDAPVPTGGTTTYTISDYPAGTQYAANEEHVLDEVLTLYTTESHFTSELRIYSSATHNGYAIGKLADGLKIVSLGLNAGNKADTLNVYGSTDGETWTLVQAVSTTATYTDYSVDFSTTNYTQFKLDVAGTQQVRVKSITLTFAAL